MCELMYTWHPELRTEVIKLLAKRANLISKCFPFDLPNLSKVETFLNSEDFTSKEITGFFWKVSISDNGSPLFLPGSKLLELDNSAFLKWEESDNTTWLLWLFIFLDTCFLCHMFLIQNFSFSGSFVTSFHPLKQVNL